MERGYGSASAVGFEGLDSGSFHSAAGEAAAGFTGSTRREGCLKQA